MMEQNTFYTKLFDFWWQQDIKVQLDMLIFVQECRIID